MHKLERDLDLWAVITDLLKSVPALLGLYQISKVHRKVATVEGNVNGKMEYLMRRNQQLRNLLADHRIDVPDLIPEGQEEYEGHS